MPGTRAFFRKLTAYVWTTRVNRAQAVLAEKNTVEIAALLDGE